ncbi:glutaredoxin 3 [Alteromonadaceae bacterium M269]|nr:glutaredoxin 3 [Alteromonadaceae bacterium M269]
MANVELYTKGYCPYCQRAKALLDNKGVKYTEFSLDTNPGLRDEMIERANGGRTVPQIFINENHVGGCDDLFMLERNNKLQDLLSA